MLNLSAKCKSLHDIITNHSKNSSEKEALLLLINGVAGTGKSYLIKALKSYLKQKCVITATTGKAAYNIRGVTVHSLLKLPTSPQSEKDLSKRITGKTFKYRLYSY